MISPTQTLALSKRAALATCILALAACGGGGGGEQSAGSTQPVLTAPDDTPAVVGVAAKGLLVGATVEVFEFNPATGFEEESTPLTTATTDANGQFTLENRPSQADLLLLTRGGTYIDESDPEPDITLKRQITLTQNQGFEAILPAGQNTVAITPFSQMVLERARREAAESGRFDDFFVATRARALEVFGFDPVSTLPANPITPAGNTSASSRQYAMALGGFANQVNATAITLGLQPNFPVVAALLSDLADGRLDGLAFDQVIEISTPSGSQPIPRFDFNDQIQRFRNNNFAQYQNTVLVEIDETELEADIIAPPPDNNPPVAVDDALTIDEDESAVVNVLNQDSDPDDDQLTVVAVSTPDQGGTATLTTDDFVAYQPAPDFFGIETFSYTISDGNGGTDSGLVTVTVNPVDDPAFVDVNQGLTLPESSSALINNSNLAAGDIDSNVPAIQFTVVTATQVGSLLFDTGDGFIPLVEDSTFTNADLAADRISYLHGGGENTQDSFEFALDDQESINQFDITILPVNDEPTANPDTAQGNEDGGPIAIDALANDTDVDGPEPLTIVAAGAVPTESGTLTITQGGQSLSFGPAPDFNGTVSTTYSVSDGAATATAALTITVLAVNDAPVALPDAYQTDEDTALNVNAANGVLSNDTDVDGDQLQAVQGQLTSQGGILTLASDGSFSFEPTQDFTGDAVFNYTAFDSQDPSASVEITISVNGQNDNPVAEDDNILGIQEDSSDNPLDVLANDSDVDSGQANLTIVAVNDYNGDGAISVAQDARSLLYSPAADFNGVETFTYTISDGDGGQATANVSVTVEPLNDDPVAQDDSFTVAEGASFDLPAPGLLDNDSDIDGDALTVETTPVSVPSHGTLTLNADGSLNYTHDGSETVLDTFDYRLLDGNGGSSTATVTINITPVNDAPVTTINDGLSVDEGGSGSIVGFNAGNLLTEDNDHASSDITYQLLTVPNSGTLTLLGTVLVQDDTFTQEDLDEAGIEYQHDGSETQTDFFDFDVFDAEGARPDDGEGGEVLAQRFDITINPINDPPVATADVFGGLQQFGATSNAARDIQPAWDPRAGSELIVFRTNRAPSTQSENLGQTSADGSVAEGNLLVGPDSLFGISAGKPGWVGTTGRVVLNAAQGAHRYLEYNVDTGAQRNVLTIPGGGGGGWMTISRDGSTAFWRFSQSGGAGQTELRTAPFASLTGQPANAVGTVVRSINLGTTGEFNDVGALTPDGSAFVLSELSGSGRDLFLRSSANGSLIRQLTFTGESLGESNNTPAVSPNGNVVAFSRLEDGAAAFNVYTVNIDGTNLTQITFDSTTTEFEPSWSPDGTRFAIRRVDTQSNGGHDGSVPDNNNIWVIPASPNPGSPFDEGGTLAVPAPGVLGNDTDADGDTLTASTALIQGVSNGSIVLNTDGSFTYTHDGGETTSDSFVYEADDANGGTSQATVLININPVNDTPTAIDDNFAVDEGATFNASTFSLLANDTDPDGDTLTVDPTPVSGPLRGTLSLNADGTLSYTHDGSENPTDSFGYRIQDGNGGTSTATVSITVNPVNDDPDANNDTAAVAEDSTSNVIDLIANDSDPDGDALEIQSVRGEDPGATVTIVAGNQAINYAPPPDYFGTDVLSYTVTDNNGGTAIAAVIINVNNVQDSPVANPDPDAGNAAFYSTNEDTSVVLTDPNVGVLANDTDVDNREGPANAGLTVSNADTLSAAGVSVSVATDGTFVYDLASNPGAFGVLNAGDTATDTFTYFASDGQSTPSDATVTITISGVNDAPVAADDTDTTDEDVAVTIDVLANDTDVDDTLDVTSVVITSPATNGSAVANSDGTVTYTPDADYNGTDSFAYTVNDATGDTSNAATVNVTIDPVNDAPVAADDTDTTDEDVAVTIDVLANDTDVDDTLDVTSVVITSPATNGSAVANSDGTVTYTPDADYNGTDSFAYTVNDATGETSNAATVNVTINSIDDAPANPTINALEVDGGQTVSITTAELTTTDIDSAAGDIVYTITTLPSDGNLLLGGSPLAINGTITQADLANELVAYQNNGQPPGDQDAFDFELSSSGGATNPNGPFTFTIDVIPVVIDLAESDSTVTGETDNALLGRIAVNIGDINGDGFDDIAVSQDAVIGAPPEEDIQPQVLVIYGTGTPTDLVPGNLDGSNGFSVFSTLFSTSERFGEAILGVDVDRDGFNDLIIGDPGADLASIDTDDGRVYVLFGASILPASNNLSDDGTETTARFEVIENNNFDQIGALVGRSLAASDINGDAYPDLLIGAPGAQNLQMGTAPGATLVLFGDQNTGQPNPQSNIGPLEPDLVIFGQADGSQFGYAVAAGDLTGDAVADMIVGAPEASPQGVPGAGTVFVIAGRAQSEFAAATPEGNDGPAVADLLVNPDDGLEYQGSNDVNANLGFSVAFADDINGDGFGDLVVGEPGALFAPGDGTTRQGLAHVLFGSATNPDPATNPNGYFRGELDGNNGLFLFPPENTGTDNTAGTDPGPAFGFSVGGGGDVNGDGLRDVLVGYPPFVNSGVGLTPQDGQAYLLFGTLTSPASRDLGNLAGSVGLKIIAEVADIAGERAGEQVTSMGDFNGDGFDDLLVSSPITGSNGQGRVHIVNGRNFLDLPMSIGGPEDDTSLNGGNPFIIAGRGNDGTLATPLGSAAANSVVRGGRGNDVLDYTTDRLADGGSNDASGMGVDTLIIGSEEGNPVRINSFAAPRAQRGRNIEVINLGNTGLAVDALEVQSLTDGRNTLRVDGTGDPANAVQTTDAWTLGESVRIDSTDYQSYIRGGATLLVDVDVDQTGILKTAAVQIASVDAAGGQTTENAEGGSISGDGRYVVFYSETAQGSLTGETQPTLGVAQVYRKNLDTGEVVMVSQAGNTAGNARSDHGACISYDGSQVAFATDATNLAGDNGNNQLLLANLNAPGNPVFTHVTQGPQGNIFADDRGVCKFAAAGDHLVFSATTNPGSGVAPADGNTNVIRYTISTGQLLAVPSATALCGIGNLQACQSVSISADGQVVGFVTGTAVDAADVNDADADADDRDVYRYDFNTDTFELVSTGAADTVAFRASMSADGSRFVFKGRGNVTANSGANARDDFFVAERTGPGSYLHARINVDADGVVSNDPHNDGATTVDISGDGRYASFSSEQEDLDGSVAPAGARRTGFVKALPDVITGGDVNTGNLIGRIFRLFRNVDGAVYNSNQNATAESGSSPRLDFFGNRISFEAFASNVVPDDNNDRADVFVFDNPLFEPDLVADFDGDGLTNNVEFAALGTNPANTDTDGDNLLDNEEVAFGGDPQTYDPGLDTDPAIADTDGDNVGDGLEFAVAGNELTAVLGSPPTTAYFISPTGGGDGSSFASPFSLAEAADPLNIPPASGVAGNPILFLYESGFYSQASGIDISSVDHNVHVGSLSAQRLFPPSTADSFISIDFQNPQRGLTIDDANNITVWALRFDSGSAPAFEAGAGAAIGPTVASTSVVLRSINLENNSTVDGDGGGLAVLNGSDATLEDSFVFSNNATNGMGTGVRGGGVFVSGTGSNLLIDNTLIGLNNVDEVSGDGGLGFGGGIAVTGGATVTVRESEIFDHTVADSGAGIYVAGLSSELFVENSEIYGNRTSGNAAFPGSGFGGGIYIDGVLTADIIDSEVRFNEAVSPFDQAAWGGGIAFVGGGTLTVSGSSIMGNNANGQGSTSTNAFGGGIYTGFSGNSVAIDNSVFADNVASSEAFAGAGGGFYTNSAGSLSIKDSRFLGNRAQSSGGGIWISDGNNAGTQHYIVNNLFLGNVADSGGAITARQLSLTGGNSLLLQNNTIAYNQANLPGAGEGEGDGGGGLNLLTNLMGMAGETSTVFLLDNIVTANDDNTVGSPTPEENYVGPAVDNAQLIFDYNLVGDQLVGSNAFPVSTDPQWLQGFYLTQATNPLVGLGLGAGQGGDESGRTASALNASGLLPNNLIAGATTDVGGAIDGGIDQDADNLDIGYHYVMASAGALNAVSAVTPLDGGTLTCAFNQEFGDSGEITVRPLIGTLESDNGRLIAARSNTAGAPLLSRTTLDPLGTGDSVQAIDRGDGSYTVYFDAFNSGIGANAPFEVEFFDGVSNTSLGSLNFVTEDFPGASCGS